MAVGWRRSLTGGFVVSNTATEYVRIIASCREMVEQIAGLGRINFLMVSLEAHFC